MSVCIITGAGGLIGSECVKYFEDKFDQIIGIDNNGRAEYFGNTATVEYELNDLYHFIDNFHIEPADISNREDVDKIFNHLSQYDIKLIIHCAAQPSHDWAATNPHRDFDVNAKGTLNLLEAYRKYCPKATFIFTSTNKVYGDSPNYGEYVELETRWDKPSCPFGIDERWQIDHTTHSLFGCSKAAADLYVQEYGRYFGLNTGVFRGGCLTGPSHKGAEQHGFLSYLVNCIKHNRPYNIYGYKGKQVRDNIHSHDVVTAFHEFYKKPRKGEVYNIGGGTHSNCSMMEAIKIVEDKLGKKANVTYVDDPRVGDHRWYISDMRKFKSHYPAWDYTYSLEQIIDEIIAAA